MKESKEVLFEVDLGYTDNYQDKDPIQGLNNNEPSKSGKSWHKGVPTGTEKPWAGKTSGKGDPFDKAVNEEFDAPVDDEPIDDTLLDVDADIMDESAMSCSSQADQKMTKSNKSSVRKEHLRQGSREVSVAGNFEGAVNENKELKKAVKELRKSLQEAYLVNVNLGKITKLFLENTTTQAEKIEIINRFNNEAKTVDQSKALFESINKQLKKGPKATQVMENKVSTATPINESKNYAKSNDVMEIINFMNRMKDC